jgi:hypothetical protein
MAPEKKPITPGMKAAMHVPGVGMMDMTFQDDGSFVAECGPRAIGVRWLRAKASTQFTVADFAERLVIDHDRLRIQACDLLTQ